MPKSIGIIGNGRAGKAFSAAFNSAGIEVYGPLTKGEGFATQPDAILICTPDSAISDVAMTIPDHVPLGHCCGAHGTETLVRQDNAFCLHPLMTLTNSSREADFKGAWAAIDGSSESMLQLASALAKACDMTPTQIDSAHRPTYHAAASIASNFLITVEAAAEHVAKQAGLPREALVPLAQATLDNWATLGPTAALTGPVARGDEETVERQREAIVEAAPELIDLFDSLCEATRNLAVGKATA